MKWFTLGLGAALLFACLANAQTTAIITMWDACDPASFNSALGPGHCVPGHHGNTLFADFIGELQSDQNAGAWRFNPLLNATAGTFQLVRLGLTSGDQTNLTAHATFPGRNGLIAFQAQTDAGVQIFTVRSNGKRLQQITHLSGDAVAPDWSPDGRQIVFEHDAPGECANVAIMNADGTGLIEFPDQTLCQFDPSFTPDGTRIVFDRYDPATNDEAFWSMDRNGNDRQRIGPCCADPNVSPDGEKLSFLGFNGDPDGSALITSNMDGSNVFQVTPYSFDVAVKQDWAPDGQHLVFTKDGDVPKPGYRQTSRPFTPTEHTCVS